MWKRNRFWVLVCLLIFLTSYFLTVGIENSGLMDSTRTIILGNYVKTPNFYIFFSYLPITFFVIFLGKVVLEKLKNRKTNKILVFFTSFLIMQVTYQVLKINWINEINSLDKNTIKLWQDILHISLPLQMFLICVLVIVSWKGEKRSRN